VEAQRTREGDPLSGEAWRQTRPRERHAGRRVVRFGRPGEELIERAPGARGVAQLEREARGVEQPAAQCEGVERGRGVPRREQGTGTCRGRKPGGGRGEIGEEGSGGSGVPRDAGEAEPQPRIGGRETGGAGQGIVARGAVCRPGLLEGNCGPGGEQRGPEARTLGPGQREVRAGGSPLPQRQLGGGEHLQRLAVLVVLEPRLPREQALGLIVAAGEQLRPCCPHDELGVRPLGPGRRGQQRLGGVPGSPGESERFGLREHRAGGLRRPRRCRRGGQQAENGPPGHCIRRTRASTRWYSERELGVNRKRPNPDSSRNSRLTRSWM